MHGRSAISRYGRRKAPGDRVTGPPCRSTASRWRSSRAGTGVDEPLGGVDVDRHAARLRGVSVASSRNRNRCRASESAHLIVHVRLARVAGRERPCDQRNRPRSPRAVASERPGRALSAHTPLRRASVDGLALANPQLRRYVSRRALPEGEPPCRGAHQRISSRRAAHASASNSSRCAGSVPARASSSLAPLLAPDDTSVTSRSRSSEPADQEPHRRHRDASDARQAGSRD